MVDTSIKFSIFGFLQLPKRRKSACPQSKKEYMSHAKLMEKIWSAKSLALRGKGKAGDLGKSVVKPIDLDLGFPKSSSTSRS